ncbi:MAG: hypothetical protein Q9227_003241 [Pyrenula ochraceoflavens]
MDIMASNLKAKEVPELNLTALHLKHGRTGAEYLHVARDDTNNVFAVNFKTNPVDDTGLPHILEHVSLCGSQKYPVRDPFFKMMPRSLANFMNAFTSSDYTSYPFATTNEKDFRNLSSVYLDATLSPLLKKSDFLQEGWRLGPADSKAGGTKDDLIFKGVVYNEMKGQMSDASYLFYVRFRDHIFPSLHNSGGDPDKMTALTHAQLVKYHQQHYHASNARFFSYGNLELASQLATVDSYLQGFEKVDIDNSIRYPRDLSTGPLRVKVPGPEDTMQSAERQHKSSVSWLTCPTSDLVENFSISLMSSLLLNGYGSPIYRGLIESGLGLNYSSNTGYDTSGKLGIFTIGLDGLPQDGPAQFEALLPQLLKDGAEEAFQQRKVDGLLHQLELALKHKTANFGMALLDKILPGWLNEVDPVESLAWNSVIDSFKRRNVQGRYLESLLEKYLLNDRRLMFTMEPSSSYQQELDANEAVRKEAIFQDVLGDLGAKAEDAVTHLNQQEAKLLEEQEDTKNSNVDCLPTLRVRDIARQKEEKLLERTKIGNANLLLHQTETNGITYFQATQTMTDLPADLRRLLPLFTECLMRLGTKTKTVGELEAEILLKSGGISIAPFTKPDLLNLGNFSEGLAFSGYSLDQNFADFLSLLRTLTMDIDFTGDRAVAAVRELLESKTSGALDSVAESGNAFAIMSAAAALSSYGAAQEEKSGLTQLDYAAKQLKVARTDSTHLPAILEKLQQIQRFVISNSSELSMRIVCDPSATTLNENRLSDFMKNLPILSAMPSVDGGFQPLSKYVRNIFYNLPYQVSYTGTSSRTVTYQDPTSAALAILGQLLTHHYLHPEVREKGGAYGASASTNSVTGLFSMSSYRDPQPRTTLNTFAKAGIFARDRAWTDRELEEAKLGVFQQLDAPIDISGEGQKEFMYGITPKMEQQRRERLLDVTQKDIQQVADKFLIKIDPEAQSTTILGEKKSWVDESFHVKSMQITESKMVIFSPLRFV